jgi:hypothetical protein
MSPDPAASPFRTTTGSYMHDGPPTHQIARPDVQVFSDSNGAGLTAVFMNRPPAVWVGCPAPGKEPSQGCRRFSVNRDTSGWSLPGVEVIRNPQDNSFFTPLSDTQARHGLVALTNRAD